MLPSPCQISSSDNQPLDRVNIYVVILNELLIDCRGVYGELFLQIILILTGFFSRAIHYKDKSTFCKHTWNGSNGNWTADLGTIRGMHYSPSHRQIFSSSREISPIFQQCDLECKYVREKLTKYVSPGGKDDMKDKGRESCLTLKQCGTEYCQEPGLTHTSFSHWLTIEFKFL